MMETKALQDELLAKYFGSYTVKNAFASACYAGELQKTKNKKLGGCKKKNKILEDLLRKRDLEDDLMEFADSDEVKTVVAKDYLSQGIRRKIRYDLIQTNPTCPNKEEQYFGQVLRISYDDAENKDSANMKYFKMYMSVSDKPGVEPAPHVEETRELKTCKKVVASILRLERP
jgi:hypothetical protein